MTPKPPIEGDRLGELSHGGGRTSGEPSAARDRRSCFHARKTCSMCGETSSKSLVNCRRGECDTGPGVAARATRRQACRRCQVWSAVVISLSFLALSVRYPSARQSGRSLTPRRWRDVRIPLDIAEAFGFCLSFLGLWGRDMFLPAANPNAPMQKGQKRQPHSKTLARGTHIPRRWVEH